MFSTNPSSSAPPQSTGFAFSNYSSSPSPFSFASSSTPSSSPFGTASPNPSSARCFGIGLSSSSTGVSSPAPAFGTPSTSPNPSSGGAPSGGFGLSSLFHKPNPTTSDVAAAAPVTFQFPPAKEEPRWESPVNTAVEFDGITISPEKASILGNIKLKHPTCLSPLRLRSESHRRSAYELLVQVIEELKGAICRKGACNSYEKVLVWLDDLEVYGFDMGWLKEEVVKLREKRMELIAGKEDKKKAREELVKQIAAIDADLAASDLFKS